MSKKITHENIKKVVSRTYNALVYYFNDDNALKFEREIQGYIKQQEELEKEYNTCVKHLKLVELHSNSKDEIIEKQQKLLELYKEALETNFEGITLIKLVNKALRTQIKELENE